LWTMGSAHFDGQRATLAGTLPRGKEPCSTPLEHVEQPAIDDPDATSGRTLQPLAGVSWQDEFGAHTYVYYESSNGFGQSDGIGIACRDDASERLLSLDLLWTADRPSFGSAAVVVDDYVYVFGGLAARFLAADVYLARVPLDGIGVPAAYEYWQGGGGYTPDADRAVPVVEGGLHPSVAWYPQQERFLMAYSTPLSREVTLRSGLTVTGPWSKPFKVVTCPAPEAVPDAFCGDVVLQPLFMRDGALRLSVARGAFDVASDAARGMLTTLWVRLAWPQELP
jgi:hypothetical protein